MKKISSLYTTLTLIVVIFIISCDKDEEQAFFYWNQTKCADPWNTGENDSNSKTEKAVIQYLEGENVDVLNLTFDNNSPLSSFCEACDCGTGQRIIIDVIDSNGNKLEELGFYQ